MDQLEKLRIEIDQADNELIDTLKKRFEIVSEVGKVKKKKGIPPLDEKRWKQVLESKKAQAEKLGLPLDLIEKIYNAIHEYALKLEEKV